MKAIFQRRAIVLAGLLSIGGLASAQDAWPSKPVTIVVPFAPGGGTDIGTRIVAQKLSQLWGQSVVVDNRGGAGGTLGVEIAAKSPPDGYTLVLASFGNILVGPALYPKLPYDPVKDLAPVVLVSTPPGLMVINPGIPAKNVKEFIAYARANTGKVNYGSAGNGVWNHLFTELFKRMAKIDMTHVPYKGTAPAITDLIAGQIQMMMSPFPTALPHVKAGRLRALAVTEEKRSPVLPNIPTVAESGLPGYAAASWFAVLAPAGTPKPVVTKVNTDINRVFTRADVKAIFAADGSEPVGGTPEELATSMREGMAKWGRLVRELNIHL